MFNIGWPELLLIMVVALVVIGPKDLPVAIRTITLVLRKMRGMATDFQRGLDDIAREAGIDEIKRSVDDAVTYDPKEALDSLAGLDDGEFSYDSDGGPGPANSILDPAAQPRPASDKPDGAAPEDEESTPPPAAEEASTAANEDAPEPRLAAPATGRS